MSQSYELKECHIDLLFRYQRRAWPCRSEGIAFKTVKESRPRAVPLIAPGMKLCLAYRQSASSTSEPCRRGWTTFQQRPHVGLHSAERWKTRLLHMHRLSETGRRIERLCDAAHNLEAQRYHHHVLAAHVGRGSTPPLTCSPVVVPLFNQKCCSIFNPFIGPSGPPDPSTNPLVCLLNLSKSKLFDV